MASEVHSEPEQVPLYLLCLASGNSRMYHLTSGPDSKLGGVSLGEDAGVPSCTLFLFALTVVLVLLVSVNKHIGRLGVLGEPSGTTP